VARILASYRPARSTIGPVQWEKAREVICGAIIAIDLPSADAVRIHASLLARFLNGSTGWTELTTPDVRVFLTEAAITAFAANESVSSRKVVASRLRRIARAVGAMTDPVRIPSNRHVIAKKRRDLADRTNCGLVIYAAVHKEAFNEELTVGMVDGLATHYLNSASSTAPTDAVGNVKVVSREEVTAAPNLVPVLEAVPERHHAPKPAVAKPTSKRAALAAARANRKAYRAAKAEIELAPPATIESLPDEVQRRAKTYTPSPQWVTEDLWHQLRPLTLRLTAGHGATTPSHFTTVANRVVQFLAWVTQQPGRNGAIPTPEELVDERLIEQYTQFLLNHSHTDRSPETSRTRLRRAVRSLRATPGQVEIPHKAINPPYTPSQCEEMIYLLGFQNGIRKRHIGFVLSLGLGAGIAAREMQQLTRSNIKPVKTGTTVTGYDLQIENSPAARVIPVRDAYVALLEETLELFDADPQTTAASLLVGTNPHRKHFLGSKSRELRLAGQDPIIVDLNRLRTTWLFALMNANIPLGSLLHLAGLRSARSLAELLPLCPAPDAAQLRTVITHLENTSVDGGL